MAKGKKIIDIPPHNAPEDDPQEDGQNSPKNEDGENEYEENDVLLDTGDEEKHSGTSHPLMDTSNLLYKTPQHLTYTIQETCGTS